MKKRIPILAMYIEYGLLFISKMTVGYVLFLLFGRSRCEAFNICLRYGMAFK